MKIYFAGSIRGGRDDQALYADLIAYLSTFGTVLTEHVGDSKLTERGEVTGGADAEKDRDAGKYEDAENDEHAEQDRYAANDIYIYERDVEWIRESDVVIAEVTTPSLGVGYEIGFAEALGIPVIALFRPSSGRRLSAMIGGNRTVKSITYQTLDDMKIKLKHELGE